MVSGFVKFLLYIRVNLQFARIIRLCYNVFGEAKYFSFFFYLLALQFGFLYSLLCNDIGGHPDDNHGQGDDYERLGNLAKFFLYALRISIGDIEVPNAVFWEKVLKQPKVMIYYTWALWMVNIYFNLIVYLNFLIAIISQVYQNDMDMVLPNEYRQKVEMNLEAEYLLNFLG